MKQLYLLLFILFFSITSGFGQHVIIDSFYTQGATWTEFTDYNAVQWTYYDGRSYTIRNDSLINGINYHLVSSKRLGSYGFYIGNSYPWFNTSTIDHGIIGGLRISGRKIYFIKLGIDSLYNDYIVPPGIDTLLYNFGLNLGDSISWKPDGKAVIKIDSLQLSNSLFAKRYFFDTSTNFFGDYWIEGMGSNVGLFGSFMHSFIPFNPYTCSRLLCFKNPYVTYTIDSNNQYWNCFDLSTVGLSIVKSNSKNNFSIYPNPGTGAFTLSGTINNEKPILVEIYNTLGQMIYKDSFTTLTPNFVKQIYMQNALPGIYFVHLITENSLKVIPLTIQR